MCRFYRTFQTRRLPVYQVIKLSPTFRSSHTAASADKNTWNSVHVMVRVAIIGGGPAGLVTLKTLLENSTAEYPVEATLFEAEDSIGGTFRYRAYENAELVSSKHLTCFSDFRLPSDSRSSPFASLPRYVEYLESYCDEFKLWDHIKLGHRVTNVSPATAGLWPHQVTFTWKATDRYSHSTSKLLSNDDALTDTFGCSHVAICTGLHVDPSIPTITGIEHLKGKAFHSSDYKRRAQVSGRKVMILGCGETAMDIAYEAVQAGAMAVIMCFRHGFIAFPKQLGAFKVFGVPFTVEEPVDTQASNLFENSYVHPILEAIRFRKHLSGLIDRTILWFISGSSNGWNQFVGTLPNPKASDQVSFLNKSGKAMPYLNREWKTESWFHRLLGNGSIDAPETEFRSREVDHIDTCTFPSHITKAGEAIFTPDPTRKDYVRMSTASKPCVPDTIIYATGYRHSFKWLHDSYPRSWDADCRDIVSSDSQDIAFIGFLRPSIGAIPPMAEMQAMWWIALIMGKMQLPKNPTHYHLLVPQTARIRHGVDFTAYMSTLARDFGGAPDLASLYWQYGWSVLVTYCLGTTFVSFYRLSGPFRSRKAMEDVEGELRDLVFQRGGGHILMFSVMPVIFYGFLNLFLWLFTSIISVPGVLYRTLGK